jgi:hypothetical protein
MVATMKNAALWDVTRCGLVRTDVLEERRLSFPVLELF